MTAYPRWKAFLVIIVLIVSFIYSLPNFYPSFPAIEISHETNNADENKITKNINQNLKIENIINKNNKLILKFNNTEDQLKIYRALQNSKIQEPFTIVQLRFQI